MNIFLLQAEDVEEFLAWRGQDDYALGIVHTEMDNYFSGRSRIWAASTGKTLIGTVQLRFSHEDADLADGTSSAYIQALEVRPEYYRQGIGKRLMGCLQE
ncbi:MAG: hypothetical protein C4332_16550 [Meiothermus sp.]